MYHINIQIFPMKGFCTFFLLKNLNRNIRNDVIAFTLFFFFEKRIETRTTNETETERNFWSNWNLKIFDIYFTTERLSKLVNKSKIELYLPRTNFYSVSFAHTSTYIILLLSILVYCHSINTTTVVAAAAANNNNNNNKTYISNVGVLYWKHTARPKIYRKKNNNDK